MEDRFEVRAWNNRTKEYVNEKGINTIYKGAYNATMLLGLFQHLKDDKQIQAIAKDFEFEQCTGLKDKYGNLIYEGDIVHVDGYVYYSEPLTLVIAFRNGAFMAGDRYIDNNSINMKIIGNIHENPELLGGK